MATVDYLLKIDGIEGECPELKHKGAIEIESFSFGMTQTGTFAHGGGGGAGKVAMQDIHFVMKMCKAAPKLMIACAGGDHIPKAVLTCRKAGKDAQEYLKLILSDVLVSSYQAGGGSGGDLVPTVQISLNFAKLEKEYKEQKADGTLGGTVKHGWDLKQNKKV